MNSIFKYIYHIIVLFFFLFEIRLVGPITTRRISIFIAIISLFIFRKKFISFFRYINRRHFKTGLLLIFGCFLLTCINTFFITTRLQSNEYLEPWYFVNLLLYIIVFSFYCVTVFENYKEFAWVIIGCFLIQSVAVFFSVTNDTVRMFLYSMFYTGADGEREFGDSIEIGSRIMGIALHSSNGSVTCSTCGIVLIYLLMCQKIKPLLFYILFAIIIVTTSFIGRTGVLILLATLLFYIISSGNRKLIRDTIFICIFTPIVIYAIVSIMSQLDDRLYNYFSEWMTAPFSDAERQKTIDKINRRIPEFSSEFILGTSVIVGRTPGGAVVSSDSGYVMNYIALGVIGSLMFYVAMLNFYIMAHIKSNKRRNYLFFVLLIIISFIIEYKEPFMLKYIFPFTIITLGLFNLKERKHRLNNMVNRKISRGNSF